MSTKSNCKLSGSDGKSGSQHRLTKEGIGYEEATGNFFHFCVSQEELDQKFQAAQQELTPILEKILTMTSEDHKFFDDETAFYSGLLSRLLLSAVIEGNRLDAAAFMQDTQFLTKRSGDPRLYSGRQPHFRSSF